MAFRHFYTLDLPILAIVFICEKVFLARKIMKPEVRN
jgi:hypothetical protein